jgi:mono/diheme cytochrome c family protein
MMRISLPGVAWMAVGLAAVVARAGDDDPASAKADPAAVEFFEKAVRPVLVARCQGCHGAEKQKGGLRLDSRKAALKGGDTGPAVVPSKPAESPLVDAVNYGELLKMPPKSRLPEAEVATLTRWVEMGAPWPEADRAGSAGAKAGGTPWAERTRHWSLLPVRRVEPPAVADLAWPSGPIDRFLLARLESSGLKPAADADRRTWIRRVTFDLTGLPPKPEEVEAFVADGAADADAKVVDRLLASPRYGERWARHWLDLVRYAETSGHEFDYDIPDAWRYRDYVVRAFNADVPFDRFVVEQVAGDLLAEPRRNPADGTNESVAATGFYFLGEGSHSPVDLREDEAMRVDNQIDVIGKAFLGLTLACARCHDHKFDAITTKDYYALSGYLRSSRFQRAFLDPPGRNAGKVAELESIKRDLISALGRFEGPTVPIEDDGSVVFADFNFEDFNKGAYEGWFTFGESFEPRPSKAGDLRVKVGDGRSVTAVSPGMAHSGLVSDRLQGVLRSRTFVLEKPFVHVRAEGKGGRINLVVDGFEKIRDPIYGGLTKGVDSAEPRWYTMNVSMWLGHRAYFELADGAIVDYTTGNAHYPSGDGYLAVDEIRLSDRPKPPAEGKLRGGSGDIPVDAPALKPLLDRYARIEADLDRPTLAPAIAEGTGEDARVHIRGSTKTLGEPVPRRFLEVFSGDDRPQASVGSGRAELARRIVDPANPLTARVLVNRLWKHHFGEGLVQSTDDFGAMGQPPSHPELLDWLASEFVRDGWSIKRMHRQIVLSHAYRMASVAAPEADAADPTNRLVHRMNVRRLEAEAIRDAMLAVSGRLDPLMFGPSVPPQLTPFMDGRGRPSKSGPLDGAGRRSLYLGVRRNFLSPLLLAFDFPTPATCIGRRNVSNVPAQALTLLNDPFVLEQARAWSQRVLAQSASPGARLDALYLDAFGRTPTEVERAEAMAFVAGESPGKGGDAWADLCHVLMNTKEFVFIR